MSSTPPPPPAGASPEDAAVMGQPDAAGRFGRFGGRFIPETLMPACIELGLAL